MTQPLTITFVDGEEVLAGYVKLNSGLLTIKDTWGDDKSSTDAITLDVEVPEGVSVPIYYTQQNGRRFILIPLDAPVQVQEKIGEPV